MSRIPVALRLALTRTERTRPNYHCGFYTDDWFGAVYTIISFGDRYRKPINIPKSNFNAGGLHIYKITVTENHGIVILKRPLPPVGGPIEQQPRARQELINGEGK